MKNASFTREYALALYRQSHEDSRKVLDELRKAQDILDQHDDFSAFLENPSISSVKRIESLKRVAGSKMHVMAGHTLERLIAKNHISLLPGIIEHLHRLIQAHGKRLNVSISSATPCTAEEKDRLATALERYAGNPVDALFETDPDLVAGFKIRIGDYLIDNSVQTELQQLSDTMRIAMYR
jgi:F-type H+-transporting ATPase subunit delta